MWGLEKVSVQENNQQNQKIQQDIQQYGHKIKSFLLEVNQLILDKPQQTKLALTCLLAGGHVLFEDLPGLGKTTLASALARLTGLQFQRIQFTNDMLASDVIGINMFNQKEHLFEFKKGPIFTQILLADEINRCSPKTQSALLEAMEEGAVTVDGVHYELPQPFWVLATQNPLFQSGTYALPESQLDRFLMRLSLGYPSRQAEKLLLQQSSRHVLIHQLVAVFDQADILHLRSLAQQVFLSNAVLNYILDLAAETRKQRHGLSTRGVLALKAASQAHALVEGRSFVTTDDVQAVFVAVVAHRLSLTEVEAKQILPLVDVL
ncbi:AAA family ATPase [Acinetobacter sp. NIPH 1852]|uniref:AAA family ATPase n=1 Tax=unclassified Acinetobacter TaxID=196816 RepID=UPI001B61925E|nr:AAA family ATPase [Acinetobacter sp. NIPH 1852]MBP8005885.1 AAA family ATPase [Acinetobacter sp.]MCH7308385.1 AAA family ATPase [Acinetobacter sp. NIPH 1852]MDR7015032.1 MoxR-like ATPase [Prolinoborus sp. 3657]